MTIDHERADRLAHDAVHAMKALHAMRHHIPLPAPGIEHSAYPLLLAVQDEPARVSTVAELMGVEVSTVSRQYSGLLSAGLVEKLPDPADGRASLIGLTASGRQVVAQMRRTRAEWFVQVLHDWEADEVDRFSELLVRFRESVLSERSRCTAQATGPITKENA